MENSLLKALDFIDRLNVWVGKILSSMIIIIASFMFYGVIMRNFFNSPQAWTFELSAMLLLAIFMLAAGNVHYHKGHVRMDVIYDQLSDKNKARIDLITSVCVLFFCGIGVYVGIKNGVSAIVAGERAPTIWHPYLWPVKLTIPVGFGLFLLQAIANYIRQIMILQEKN